MARLVERALSGVFRSRWGVAVVLGVLVLAIVGTGRIFGSGDDGAAPLVGSDSAAPAISIDPDEDDSVISAAPPMPTTRPGTAKPEAVAYAFAQAWVDHRDVTADEWHDRLVPNATKELADELADTDPEQVPADRVVGRPGLVPLGDTVIDAEIEMDSGKLTLRLVSPEGRWLVGGIDWAGA